MTERDHRHGVAPTTTRTNDLDMAPGCASASARLDAPTHPITSGLIQRKAERDANGVTADADGAVAAATSSTGSALPASIMRKFESSLGADLSSVRVHTGAASASAASAVGARAYTMGQDIHFGAGQFDPSSGSGQHLLAHEVAHTVQQRGGAATRQNKLEVSAPADAAEHEADRAADAMVTGKAASVVGYAPTVARLATAYSDDQDLKVVPEAPRYVAADGSFAAMDAALASSMQGNGGSIVAPRHAFDGAKENLVACRENAEASNVYYSTHQGFLDAANVNAAYARIAQVDASWAIGMLGDLRVAADATALWVSLANASNEAWSNLVKRAKAKSIQVIETVEPNNLAGLADGQKHVKPGDEKINALETSGSGGELGVLSRQMGIAAPDTGQYRRTMTSYTKARNDLASKQNGIITKLIPNTLKEINEKREKASDEKEKWETIAHATHTFEQGLMGAFNGAEFLSGETLAIGAGEEELVHPKFAKEATEKGAGVAETVLDVRINAIQAQIAAYDTNLKGWANEESLGKLKRDVGDYQNALVNVRTAKKQLEDEQASMAKKLAEFGKRIDEATQKRDKSKDTPTDAREDAELFAAIRTAKVTTEGALDGLSSGGVADLPALYQGLASQANRHAADQTGRTDPRSAVFAIEAGRWNSAVAAINNTRAQLYRRNSQVHDLEMQFMQDFEKGAHSDHLE